MRSAVLGVLVGAALAMAALGAWSDSGTVFAQRPAPPQQQPVAAGTELIAVPGPAGEKGQLLTVIDPKMRVMSVYQIGSPDGKIVLRSVRNISWDLQMTQYNNQSPLPEEIRSLLEQR